MKIVCGPEGTAFPRDADVPFILYGATMDPRRGTVGNAIPAYVKRRMLRPSRRAWDFLSISLAIVAADESCRRDRSADGWTREIDLHIHVSEPSFWTTQLATLEAALRFLSGDIWRLSIYGDGFLPAPPRERQIRGEDVVCLLSGGMDSLVGAIDIKAEGKRPLLVSQTAKGDKKDQLDFARIVAPDCEHIQLNHQASPPDTSERSQRARSLGFFGFGVLAATCLASHVEGKTVDLVVAENGYISLNIPLTPLRLGSLSTRTTHPYYLAKIQEVLDAAGLRVRLHNPYQFKTKGEMLAECCNQALLKKLIGRSTSCGRYARTGFTQCGRCVPCQVRRAAFERWGVPDPTKPYKYADLSKPDRRHRDFDDVRSVAMAAETVRTAGLDAWIGGALSRTQLGDIAPYRAVAQRGLEELRVFLSKQGAV